MPLVLVLSYVLLMIKINDMFRKILNLEIVYLISVAFLCFVFFSLPVTFPGIALDITKIAFLVPVWSLFIYMRSINSFTVEGRKLFRQIKGFFGYLSVAEEHITAMSFPVDKEKIFANCLPYAFEIENKWVERHEDILFWSTISVALRDSENTANIRTKQTFRRDTDR